VKTLSIKSNHGFTLIEVVIAVSIMAFISIFTAQTIQTAIKQKRRITVKIAQNSKVRDVLFIMQQDIQKAFNYYDHPTDLYNLAHQEREKRKEAARRKAQAPNAPAVPGAPSPSPQPPGFSPPKKPPFKPRPRVEVTQFLGEKHELNFTTLSHARSRFKRNQSDQAEVGYFIKSCKEQGNPEKSSKCVWRRTSPIIDKNIKKGGSEVVLIEDVEELSFRYTGPEKKGKWQDSWLSDKKEDSDIYHKFPSAVEIKLKVKANHKKGKPLEMTFIAAVRFPNNYLRKTKKKSNSKLNNQKKGP